jgi:hypothetical protein
MCFLHFLFEILLHRGIERWMNRGKDKERERGNGSEKDRRRDRGSIKRERVEKGIKGEGWSS